MKRMNWPLIESLSAFRELFAAETERESSRRNALVLRHSFANPPWWFFHFYMHFEHKRRGRMV